MQTTKKIDPDELCHCHNWPGPHEHRPGFGVRQCPAVRTTRSEARVWALALEDWWSRRKRSFRAQAVARGRARDANGRFLGQRA